MRGLEVIARLGAARRDRDWDAVYVQVTDQPFRTWGRWGRVRRQGIEGRVVRSSKYRKREVKKQVECRSTGVECRSTGFERVTWGCCAGPPYQASGKS